MSSSDMFATISFSSGYLPKKFSRVYAPPLALKFWYSPSTHSSITRRSRPLVSRASSGSQREPQMTLMTFQPAPRNAASSSWMILPLPRTGPSRRCRLQLMTNTRLSSCSRTGIVIAPIDSGSSISPSPRNAQTLRSDGLHDAAMLEIALKARLVDRHHRARGPSTRSGTARSPASATDADTSSGRRGSRTSWRKWRRWFSVSRPSRNARA